MRHKHPFADAPPKLIVRVERGKVEQEEYTFSNRFTIGRDRSCDIFIEDQIISRRHVEVYYEDNRWWMRDLDSANGTYVDGIKVDAFSLSRSLTIELGVSGPLVSFHIDEFEVDIPKKEGDTSLERYISKYFSDSPGEDAGEHTMHIRRAFQKVQKKQKSKFQIIIAAAALLIMIISSFAIYQNSKIKKQKKMAMELFYNLKKLELEQAKLKDNVEAQKVQVDLIEEKRGFDRYLEKTGIMPKNLDVEEALIYRVAEKFGECKVNLPDNFIQEVKTYIEKWQSNKETYRQAIMRARSNNYTSTIIREFHDQGLVPQFFYIALQESKFEFNACGPKTSSGYAKGMWQFIPATAKSYGLKLGPWVKEPKYDPEDERHDVEKATRAAAKYIRDIYTTDAQASGLLVMASYNWGEGRVIKIIKKMPMDPSERNFWRLLEDHVDKIPDETYDYVFKIFSAAVIGENPRHFGFNFDNPLG